MVSPERVACAIPAKAGIGLKPEHYDVLISRRPRLGFLEIHAENYMGAGGAPHYFLAKLRDIYPISLHGVGLSIGAEKPIDREHLKRLRDLAERCEPGLFSEHLAWSTHGENYFADLLPLAYNAQSLKRVCEHIDEVQTFMGRRMLLENPSTYLSFEASTYSEIDFLSEVVSRTGCGLLLDVNNVFVSAANHGQSAEAYLDAFPVRHVGEIHLGGHDEQTDSKGAPLMIDSHGAPVAEVVWTLYRQALARAGAVPTLIEWDNNVPPFDRLWAEAERAEEALQAELRRRNTDAYLGASEP